MIDRSLEFIFNKVRVSEKVNEIFCEWHVSDAVKMASLPGTLLDSFITALH